MTLALVANWLTPLQKLEMLDANPTWRYVDEINPVCCSHGQDFDVLLSLLPSFFAFLARFFFFFLGIYYASSELGKSFGESFFVLKDWMEGCVSGW